MAASWPTVGSEITLLENVKPWYSGYGMNPDVTLPAGTIARVQSVDVPTVFKPLRPYFVAVATAPDGTIWQADFRPNEKGTRWDDA